MNYLSVCSGVEAATVAWHPMGWNPLAFSEIEKFPSEVLAHHYPTVPNLGDMTNYKEWDFGTNRLDLLVGGTPCQSFSVAGLRKGLDDPRGNLALIYCGILDKFRPKWFVWENVPGVLSSSGGRDFGAFLGALAELGYGFSYRVLDAQNFGVPQRRRRVFVVGHLGDWRPTAKVLFESESLSGNTKQSRKARERVTTFVESSFGAFREDVIGGTTKASGGVLGGGSETLVYENHPSDGRITQVDVCPTMKSRWGTGGGNIPLVQSIGFTQCDAARDAGNNISPTLRSGGDGGYPSHSVAYGIPGNWIGRKPENGGNAVEPMHDLSPCLTGADRHGVSHQMTVRKLTPIECERLQGFPDNYTNIKEKCPDGSRYKAMGNSMAVPVMKWIGNRIHMVENDNS